MGVCGSKKAKGPAHKYKSGDVTENADNIIETQNAKHAQSPKTPVMIEDRVAEIKLESDLSKLVSGAVCATFSPVDQTVLIGGIADPTHQICYELNASCSKIISKPQHQFKRKVSLSEIVNLVKSEDFLILFGISEGDCIFIEFYSKDGSLFYLSQDKLKRNYFNGSFFLKSSSRRVGRKLRPQRATPGEHSLLRQRPQPASAVQPGRAEGRSCHQEVLQGEGQVTGRGRLRPDQYRRSLQPKRKRDNRVCQLGEE